MSPIVRVACCHVSPVFLDAEATTAKCVDLIRQAARGGADLVTFPETYISAFPFWSTCISPAETHNFFVRMAQNSVYADGDEVNAVRQAARDNKIAVSLGISEKARYSSATLWNSNLIISADGEVLVHHRKLMPTFFEKLTWAPGDGHGLKVVDLTIGKENQKSDCIGGDVKLGMLICGENTNPLARYALMAQGEQIHITTWPAKAPMRTISRDALPHVSGDHSVEGAARANVTSPGFYDNLAANRTRAAEHCFEAKCFGVICSGVMTPAMISDLVAVSPEHGKDTVATTMELSTQAESLFLDPNGMVVPAFTVDKEGNHTPCDSLRFEEGILFADLDITRTIEPKQFQDVVGGYQRLDVFDLRVNTTRQVPAHFE